MTTIDEKEIKKFADIADQWWNEDGKFKPLHKFNPVRITYIRNQILDNFKINKNLEKPLSGLKILDVGCGGGLLCEPLSRLGGDITGIDVAQVSIKVAKEHAKQSKLKINYIHNDIETLSKRKNKFDVVLVMEVVEHVKDVEKFIQSASKCLRKGGLLFVATINRTIKSYLNAIIGAEYILRWLDIGTHSWNKFLKPSEINTIANNSNLSLIRSDGFKYNLINDQWSLTRNLDINYVMLLKKNL